MLIKYRVYFKSVNIYVPTILSKRRKKKKWSDKLSETPPNQRVNDNVCPTNFGESQ